MFKKILLILIMLLVVAIPASLLAMSDNYFSERTDIYIKQTVISKTSDIYANIIKQEFNETFNTTELVNYQYNSQNEIESILINSKKVNELVYIASSLIKKQLDEKVIETELEQISFPLGQLVSKAIFAGTGPDIYIKVDPITSYKVDIKSIINEYGINNAVFEIYLISVIEVEVMIPLKQEKVTCENKTLILSQIISGDVPHFYYSN